MSARDVQDGETGGTASSGPFDLKLEVVVISMADADRSKASYARLRFRLDPDFPWTTVTGSCSSRPRFAVFRSVRVHDHGCPTWIWSWPPSDRV
jgi:hypothetical protein